MGNKELDTLVESYFDTKDVLSPKNDLLSFEMLVEMIEETIGDSYPDIAAASDPAGFDQNINPEMIATQVPHGAENDRATIEQVVAQIMGAPDPAMVDSVMMYFDDHQGLANRGSASAANVSEGRLPPEQWKEIYRQLLMVGVDSEMVEAIKMLADSGMSKDDLQAMLTQQSMQDARGMQQMNEKKKGGRFSYKIDIPALVPSEAWGDPNHQSREDIERVFNVIRKKHTMQERIAHVNEFMDPASAARKAPGGNFHAVIRMMQIIEALQATLNDYTESSAGFVFEGFMAALTGGKQQADRVGGTLPIEDFIGVEGEQVSLKLLSPGTGIHGSFTNLLDYLYLRGGGQESIKYLIAYKDSDGDDVSRLKIYDFVIDHKNFVEVMKGAGEFEKKFGASVQPVEVQVKDEKGEVVDTETLPALPDLLSSFQNTDEWRMKVRKVLTHGTETSDAKGKKKLKPHVPGYTKAGMFHNSEIISGAGTISDTDKLDADAAAAKARLDKRKKGGYHQKVGEQTYRSSALRAGKQAAEAGVTEEEAWREFLADNENMLADLMPAVENPKDEEEVKAAQAKQKRDAKKIGRAFKSAHKKYTRIAESYFGSFHETEKIFLEEQQLLSEGGRGSEDASSQWTISGTQMINMTNVMNVTDYGELNMSAENIDACADIYIQKMEGDMIVLLETTKEFTTNVGNYFSAAQRRHANKYADNAIDNAQVVVDKLQKEKQSSNDEDSE